jgi:hypothetical protein
MAVSVLAVALGVWVGFGLGVLLGGILKTQEEPRLHDETRELRIARDALVTLAEIDWRSKTAADVHAMAGYAHAALVRMRDERRAA